MSNQTIISQKEKYLFTFKSKNDLEFGFRYGIPEDAGQIGEIFKDIYGWNYLYPKVYDPEQLINEINDINQTWFVVENIKSNEIVGTGVMLRKSKISVCASKTVILNKYQNYGIARVLGTQSVLSFLSDPKLQDVIRLDTDVRANNLHSQKFAEKIRCIPYGFIPNYNNYGDKRNFKASNQKSFTSGRIESVVMYFSPIKNFWKLRDRNIVLLDNENILKFYNLIKENIRRMNKDTILLHKSSNLTFNSYSIEEDHYKSIIIIQGYLNQQNLKDILKRYSDWNVIEWRIPTTLQGLNSQEIALKHSFKVVGYDPGSFIDKKSIHDTIVCCYFPNGVDFNQFKDINVADKNRLIVENVLESLKDFKINNIT
ncbi:MAG: hypothetical protein ACFFBP_18910 [Promethearchaeota archaeon]